MKITAITATYQRPQAYELCKRYMASQTRQPDQWLVLDGPEPMGQKLLGCVRSGVIEGDAIVIWEDDDLYLPDWIEWCEAQLNKGYSIVGEGLAIYYNVRRRWMSNCLNTRHASLCQTAFTRDLLPALDNIIESFDNQFFDTRLWRLNVNKHLYLPKDGIRRVIGMKGMPGTKGYSAEHSQVCPPGTVADPSLYHLWNLVGPYAGNYSDFYFLKQ